MLVNYKVRCVIDADDYQVIRYGVSANEANDGGREYSWWRDMPAPYAKLSRGGRRPGNPVEMEWKTRKHFFNKRIMVDEESVGGQKRSSVQGDRDDGGVVARDGEGGAYRVKEAEAAARSDGCGDPDCKDENCNYGSEEVTT